MKKLTCLFYFLFVATLLSSAQNTDNDSIPAPNSNIPCSFIALVDVGGETDICPGTSLELSTPAAPGNTYQWLFNDELIVGANSAVYQATAAGSYAVIVYTRGCRGESLPVEVTVKDASVFNPLPDQINICGTQTSLNAGSGYLTYQWNNGFNDSIVNVTSSGNYQVTVMDDQGCFFTDQSDVSIIDFSLNQTDQSVCAGAPIQVSVSGAAVGAGYVCSWSGVGFNGAGYQVDFQPQYSGILTAIVTDGQGICADSLMVTVKSVSNSIVQASVCDSYEWNGANYTTSGIYTYITSAANGCDSIVRLYLEVNHSSNMLVEVAACQSYSWHGEIFDQSGVYTYQFVSSNGCDSVVVLNLTILQPSTSDYNVYSCGPYEWNGVTYAQSGNYTVHALNSVGCDSTATLHLTVINTSYSTTEIVSVEPILWNGNIYSESGNYVFVSTNQYGCDSLAILDLIILAPLNCTITSSDAAVCPGNPVTLSAPEYTIPDNPPGIPSRMIATSNRFSVRYTYLWSTGDTTATIQVHPAVTTTYTVTISDGYSTCTGSYTVVVNQPSYSEESVTVCQWVSYNWNGNEYNASGDYTYTTTNAAGCDSIAVLHLTINTATSSETTATACGTYEWNGNVYSASGDYTFTTLNAAGCDSTAVLHLTINTATSSETTATACGAYEWNGNVYTASGDYTFTTFNAAGCDSIAVLHLSINTATSSETTATACGTYEWNGNVYTASGDYTFTTLNAAGCDSTAVLYLTINTATSSETTATACGTYEWNGNVYTASGDYTFTTFNAAGCDSNAVLHLTINTATSSETTAAACGTYEWNGNVYTASGNYTFTTFNAAGCDSNAVLHLTINTATSSETTATACGTYEWNGNVYSASGDYTFTTLNAAGCDSTAVLHLTINTATSSETTATACGTYEWNGNVYMASGNYTFTTLNAAGCDSTAVLHLTIGGQPATIYQTASACNHYSWLGVNYTSSGTYTFTQSTASGCDTTFILQLQILHAPTSPGAIQVTRVNNCGRNRFVLSVNPVAGATSYQWNVPNGTSILNGQGTNSITVMMASNNSHCSNQSICVTALNNCGSSLPACINWPTQHNNGNDDDDDDDDDENDNDDDNEDDDDHHGNHHTASCNNDRLDFYTYPNPATNWLTINSNNASIHRIEIIDNRGKVIIQTNTTRQIPVAHLASGHYFVRVYSNKGVLSKGIFIIR